MKCILQENTDRASNAKVFHAKRFALDGRSKQDVFNPSAQILQVFRKAKDCHNLACRRDVEATLHRHTIGLRSKSRHDITEVAVVDVEDAFPQHFLHGKAFFAMLIDVVVEQGRNHVVSGRYSMEIACEVQVNLVHRQHLSIATTSGSALHAETRSERGLTKSHDGLLSDTVHAKSETHADRSLPDACLRGRDGRNEDELVLLYFVVVDKRLRNLRCVSSVRFYLICRNTETVNGKL